MIRKSKMLFDYLFYRSYCFYKKFDDKDPLFMSVLVVSLFQLLSIILVFVLTNSIFKYVSEKSDLFIVKAVIVLLSLGLILLNYQLYKANKVFELSERRDNEDKIKRIKRGWFLSGLLLFPIVFVVCYSVFK